MSTLALPILGVVLAGGLSSRMGRDKANILVSGNSLLEHAVGLLFDCKVDLICVSGREYGDEWILDFMPNKGPLGAIYSIVNTEKYKKFSSLLIIPVDMPFLTVDVIHRLIADLKNHQAIYYENKQLPLLVKNNGSLADALNLLFKNEALEHDFSIKKLLSLIKSKSIKVNDELIAFVNINTEDDLKGYLPL